MKRTTAMSVFVYIGCNPKRMVLLFSCVNIKPFQLHSLIRYFTLFYIRLKR